LEADGTPKQLGDEMGFDSESESSDSEDDDAEAGISEEELKRRQRMQRDKVGHCSLCNVHCGLWDCM
jgi:hypothetical protein